MLVARAGEEIVCPKGTVCGRLTRDANDQIIDGDFTARESSSSHADQRYVCACGGRPVAVRESLRWMVANGHVEVVKALLEKPDIDVNAADRAGRWGRPSSSPPG